MDYLLAPDQMNPLIENTLDKAYDHTLSNIEGRRSVAVSPIIQIVIHGSTNVITNIAAFPDPQDMLPGCMNAIRAAEGTRAQATGYVLIGTGIVLDGVETYDEEDAPPEQTTVPLVGVAVDRHSWGKTIVSNLQRSGGVIVVVDRQEYSEHGLFAGTVFDPWDAERNE